MKNHRRMIEAHVHARTEAVHEHALLNRVPDVQGDAYRILSDALSRWSTFLNRRVHLPDGFEDELPTNALEPEALAEGLSVAAQEGQER